VAEPATVTVEVIGGRQLAGALSRHLPAGYRVHQGTNPDAIEHPDAIVLADATAGSVAAVLLRHPATPVIGVIGALDPVQTLVGVLEAGADTCIRSSEAGLLASHLLACLRRRRVLGPMDAPGRSPAEA
jgi:hypothetical protein